MRRFFRYVLLALVLLTVMLVSAMTAMRLAIHGREVAVPKLVGMTVEQAERVTSSNGLLLDASGRYFSSDVAEGRIISQLPPTGIHVRRGWQMRVAVSLGPQRVVIPNLVGQSPRAAEINARRRGLEVAEVATAHLPQAPADEVIAQSPPASADTVISPKLNLLVSAPEEERAYVMPNLVGKHLGDVVPALEDVGLKLGTVSTVAGGTPTVILKQSPPAGQRVTPGMAVSFEVGK
jgi:eukaryotic-like serine/threonine-protein kinase